MTDVIEVPAPQQDLVTRSGYRFQVRGAEERDEAALEALFEHVSPQDLRFRFLTAVGHVPHDMIAAMSHVDHDRTENFLAIDADGTVVGSAMVAADDQLERAEVAISIHEDYKGRGIGWTLLEHVAADARRRGIKRLQCIESRDNHAAIELEREMGFTARAFEGEPGLVIVESVLNP
ncbi:MAG: GNAT family N-acetyltransferase [Sphingobium sp.]|jgi:N-acetylglutamate synthase-like GNAT family acetyltransferase|nr:GNAT family N-acetyltransferase [Sphingobium sp.]MCI1270550.1 GNAT family N-acetyltransferase [Sphingobium sp.]MCI1755405.1 GNAT family N-acetyltransferase [Sphingobium sp.]MCI2053213.1 GNAT family N-acetyltransferase [Sphingobium sp.]